MSVDPSTYEDTPLPQATAQDSSNYVLKRTLHAAARRKWAHLTDPVERARAVADELAKSDPSVEWAGTRGSLVEVKYSFHKYPLLLDQWTTPTVPRNTLTQMDRHSVLVERLRTSVVAGGAVAFGADYLLYTSNASIGARTRRVADTLEVGASPTASDVDNSLFNSPSFMRDFCERHGRAIPNL
jgi:hypothetical protein